MPLSAMEAGLNAIKAGFAGSLGWGENYAIRRLSGSVSGSLTTATPVIASLGAALYEITKRDALENVSFDILKFNAICDPTNLQKGDLCTGIGNDTANYYFAQHRLLKEIIWIRAEQNATVRRAYPTAGAASTFPSTNTVTDGGSTYASSAADSWQNLTLTNGVYAFQSGGTAAIVPMGLQPQNRARGDHAPHEIPTSVKETQFIGYLPILPGVQIRESDKIVIPNINLPTGDVYVIEQLYSSGSTGLAGTVLLLTKVG